MSGGEGEVLDIGDWGLGDWRLDIRYWILGIGDWGQGGCSANVDKIDNLIEYILTI